MSGTALAAAAMALAGTRFRLHGRDPATGLDCIGVLSAALAAIGRDAPLPQGYRLRTRRLPDIAAIARACGLCRATGPHIAGDVLLLRTAPCQFHLAIDAGGNRFVHAHAGLGRVTITPGPLSWPVIARWRI